MHHPESRSQEDRTHKSGVQEERERRDVPRTSKLSQRKLRHPLWVHPAVSDELRKWTHLYNRLGLVLGQLAAHGRTTIVKGCQNVNRGWRRSPLGGIHGSQYYLWWSVEGSRVCDGLAMPHDGIAIRAVRHHDNHEPLPAGSNNDYLELEAAEEINEDIAGTPWTPGQNAFVAGQESVRLLRGRPGAGKTSALWRAIEARANEAVLYLTWSPALAEQAEEHFESFAPRDVRITTLDFRSLIGELAGVDVPRQSLEASRAAFAEAITRIGRGMSGAWENRLDALHAEMRSILYGRAIPGASGTTQSAKLYHLEESTYSKMRGNDNAIGAKAARSVLKVVRAINERTIRQVFPELVAAGKAHDALRSGKLPDGFETFDRIVIDELQDLTLIETSTIIEMCKLMGRKAAGRRPHLLMAGDAGQTVQATAFSWTRTTAAIRENLQEPKSYDLDEHVRCPHGIATVVDRAAGLYTSIEKDRRPTKQHKQAGGEHVDAQLVYVPIDSQAEAERVIERVAETDGTAVITAGATRPRWLPAKLHNTVLTPHEAKGLEYQNVCVIGAGQALQELKLRRQEGTGKGIEQEILRNGIDHLRVGLSRATETLALIDVEASAEEKDGSTTLLLNAVPYNGNDLVEHLASQAADPEERVMGRTEEANRLIDSAPLRAWQLAVQAVQLLGDPLLPNGITDHAIRMEARTTLLRIAAGLMASTDGSHIETAGTVATRTVHVNTNEPAPKNDRERAKRTAIQNLEYGIIKTLPMLQEPESGVSANELLDKVALLEELTPAEAFWPRYAIRRIAQKLRTRLGEEAKDAEYANQYGVECVQRRLEVTGYTGDANKRATHLTRRAFDTLLQAANDKTQRGRRPSRLKQARQLLTELTDDTVRTGRLNESEGNTNAALAAYAKAGATSETVRLHRTLGNWEAAAEQATGEAADDIKWLLKLETLTTERPSGQNRRLRPAERRRLTRALDKIQRRARENT